MDVETFYNHTDEVEQYEPGTVGRNQDKYHADDMLDAIARVDASLKDEQYQQRAQEMGVILGFRPEMSVAVSRDLGKISLPWLRDERNRLESDGIKAWIVHRKRKKTGYETYVLFRELIKDDPCDLPFLAPMQMSSRSVYTPMRECEWTIIEGVTI